MVLNSEKPNTSIGTKTVKKYMGSIDNYTRATSKQKEVELNTLSEYDKAIRFLIKCRIQTLKNY